MAYGAGDFNLAFPYGNAEFVLTLGAFVVFVSTVITRFHGGVVLCGAKTGGNSTHPAPDRIPPAKKPFVFLPALFLIPRKHTKHAEDEGDEGKHRKDPEMRKARDHQKNAVEHEQRDGDGVVSMPPVHRTAPPEREPGKPVIHKGNSFRGSGR